MLGLNPLGHDHPLAEGGPPVWASTWGQGIHGVFADFELAGREYRMRWVPGGSFIMGSPADEPGRYEDESQHEVSLDGFWLGELPCSQALWEAVMDDNPSRFRSPDRPVEQVSWLDCERMMKRLAARVPGLEPRFPTEAEWEYACRAGRAEATYAGAIEIRGMNDAPVLDAIAWYGGNSGVGFELDDGADSSRWLGRQFDHDVTGTRSVGLKRPNDWGLYDMLGNVWEWCADWFGPYSALPVINPGGPSSAVVRAYRGGSWSSDARDVRAACRAHGRPGLTWYYLGFRLALGRGSKP
ncbi:MAG: formylglycine-generating enzyme family protein [Planctomycetes bacterium]|nr:formylglycine-generating enzyme family protein [Planctomycetota bacterium]